MTASPRAASVRSHGPGMKLIERSSADRAADPAQTVDPRSPRSAHPERDESRRLRDDRRHGGTSGSGVGTSGSGAGTKRRTTLRAILILALVAAVVLGLKAFLAVQANHEAGLGVRAIQPWPVEVTRFLGFLAALPIALRASRIAREWTASLSAAAIALGAALFVLAHLLVMLGMRVAAHINLDEAHAFRAARDLPYEIAGALLAYAIAVATFAALRPDAPPAEEHRQDREPAADEPDRSEPPALACLADGGRTVEIALEDLRAVCGSGNYVELIFADRRRSMLRTTLTAAEAALAGHGFRRSHKSWLVRIAAVREVERTASGDFRLDLGDGVEAPLSRRNGILADELRKRMAGSARSAGPG